ncbi:hypothetical protein FOZ60_012992 [Perkinsus olseni]|uniref:Uncharacterized protein n=1 Tax=Perkinsus olseni TaxID=32597 RepID=A0A7J6NCW5_PEROL|nr:hypothetical protein FOZ60_012992 [Perkinsus olseni]
MRLKKNALVDSGSALSIIDAKVLGELPVSFRLNTADKLLCTTANMSKLHTLGSVVLDFLVGSSLLSGKFYISASPLVTPIIIGRDVMAASGMTVRFENRGASAGLESASAALTPRDYDDWKTLPPGWEVDEVVYSTSKVYIVSARRSGPASEDQPKHRFYVGVNPSMVKDPSRAEQLGAVRAHKKLLEASKEARQASDGRYVRERSHPGRPRGLAQAIMRSMKKSSPQCFISRPAPVIMREYHPEMQQQGTDIFGRKDFREVTNLVSSRIDISEETRCFLFTGHNFGGSGATSFAATRINQYLDAALLGEFGEGFCVRFDERDGDGLPTSSSPMDVFPERVAEDERDRRVARRITLASSPADANGPETVESSSSASWEDFNDLL